MENKKNIFSWNGWNYYQTKTGKLKKFISGQKVENCSDEEFDFVAKKYREIFGKNN